MNKQLLILSIALIIYVIWMLTHYLRARRHKTFRRNYEALKVDLQSMIDSPAWIQKYHIYDMEEWIEYMEDELSKLNTLPYPEYYSKGIDKLKTKLETLKTITNYHG